MICDMIIKAIRYRSRSNVGRLIGHLQNGNDNEAISFLLGTPADIADMHVDATRKNSKYSIRHWIISPHEATTRGQMREVVAMIAKEFGFEVERAVIVEHRKRRATADAFDAHWHVLVGELHPVSGKVLRCSFDRVLHELVARFSEYKFGHKFVQGKHTKSVIAGLRQRGAKDAASSLEAELGDKQRPSDEAFTHNQHQAQKRAGIDISVIKQAVKKAMATATTRAELTDLLSQSSLLALPGDKPGTWIVADQDGEFIGSLARLSGARKSEINKIMGEAKDEQASTTDHNRTGDPDRNASYSKPTGAENRRTSSKPGTTGSDTGQDTTKPRTTAERDRAPQSEARPTQTSNRNTISWLQKLDGYRDHLSTLLGKANLLAMSPDERLIAYLWEMEEQARADLNRQIPIFEYSEATDHLRAEVANLENNISDKWNRHFTLERRLGKIKKPRWWHYLLGVAFVFERQQRRLVSAVQHASNELEICRSDLESVKSKLLRQESIDKQQHATLVESISSRRRAAGPMLEQVVAANEIIRLHPSLAFCGLSFILARARAQVDERKRIEAAAEKNLDNGYGGYSR